MAQNSKIEWCDHTVNLWWGCSKVHIGRTNCYAQYLCDVRYKNDLWNEKNRFRLRIKSAFTDLDKYQKKAKKENKRIKIFVGSMMDIFDDNKYLVNPTEEFQNTNDLRTSLFNKIDAGDYNNLIFLFLTKRPENIAFYVPNGWIIKAPNNVWFGTSISDQRTANIYRNRLVNYRPNNLFLSIEPQVGEILSLDLTYIKWVIQGGESGQNNREFQIQWAYDIMNACKHQKTAYFFKQIDKKQPIPNDLLIREFPIELI